MKENAGGFPLSCLVNHSDIFSYPKQEISKGNLWWYSHDHECNYKNKKQQLQSYFTFMVYFITLLKFPPFITLHFTWSTEKS